MHERLRGSSPMRDPRESIRKPPVAHLDHAELVGDSSGSVGTTLRFWRLLPAIGKTSPSRRAVNMTHTS